MKTTYLSLIILSALALPPAGNAAIKTWDGSASGFWTNAANWTPSGAPVNGDTLVFPAGVARLAMTNSSGAPSNFSRLLFSGSNYVVFGPTLTITNGLTNAVVSATNTLKCPVRLGADQSWTNHSRAVLLINSNLNLNGHTLTFGSLGTFEVNGALTNSGKVVKAGNGTLNFNGISTFTGTLTLQSGPLRVDGALTAASLVLNGGILEGTGSVHGFTANSGSTVAPGDEFTPGQLTSTAGVHFNPGANFDVDLNGTVAGTGFDQLAVIGTVDLGGAALVHVLGFVPSVGDTFLILHQAGADPVTNTFAGLPEGALLVIGATRFTISYRGGSGNDVVLTTLPPAASRFWTGNGTNALSSNASNWLGNTVPFPGDDLVFGELRGQLVRHEHLYGGHHYQ